MQLRKSRVLKKLKAGEIVSSIKLNFSDGRVAELAALCGADCLWLDLEHVANDWSVIEKQIWAAKAYDVDVVVRVARGSYSDYVKPFELDATGIMVPHVTGFTDACKVVQIAKFHPLGKRPFDGGNADGPYGLNSPADYTRQANAERFIIAQIEDPKVMPDLEAMAMTEGIDILLFGPGDFSHQLGVPGQWNHPEVVAARKKVADVACRYGKFAGTIVTDGNLSELIDLGYQFINIGADVLGMGSYFQERIQEFKDKTDGRM